MDYFNIRYYLASLTYVASALCIAVFSMLLVRLFGWWYFAEDVSIESIRSLPVFLFTGMRFDVAVLLRAYGAFVLLSGLAFVLPQVAQKWLMYMFKWYILVILLVFLVLGMGNLAYMEFFSVPFDEFAIEGLLYDWSFLLSSLLGAGSASWFALFALLAAIFVVVGTYTLARWLYTQIEVFRLNVWLSLVVIVISSTGTLVLARGTVSVYPLERKHSAVTSDLVQNKLVENGLFALYQAWDNVNNTQTISAANDNELRQAYARFYQKQAKNGPVYPQLFATTKFNQTLVDKPPHVILGLVESLSTALMDVAYTGSKQLGRPLRDAWQQDLVFKRFTPAHSSTQSSLVNLLTNLDFATITYTQYRNVPLSSAVAEVYRSKGYRTIYIYSGYEAEYNNQTFLLRQGFDEHYGAYALKRMYPQAKLNVQGTEDYYAFAYAKQLLTNSDEPLFIVVQTINNHPPYKQQTMPNQPLSPLVINERLKYINGSLPNEALYTYQYTTQVLANFIDNIKSSALADNTIFAFTGDHGVRGLASDAQHLLALQAVPFYLYIPDYIKPDYWVDTNQLASHRDIMPTLFNLSLSQANYLNLGRNLLQADTGMSTTGDFAVAYGHVVTEKGYQYAKREREIYPFINKNSLLLDNTSEPINEITRQQAQGYFAITDWLKRYQLYQE